MSRQSKLWRLWLPFTPYAEPTGLAIDGEKSIRPGPTATWKYALSVGGKQMAQQALHAIDGELARRALWGHCIVSTKGSEQVYLQVALSRLVNKAFFHEQTRLP